MRNNTRTRILLNLEEVCSLYKDNDFEIIDSDFLSLKEQINIFGSVKHLAGIHGAGLTNMIWRYPYNMTISELFSRRLCFHHYCIMASIWRYNYNFSIGEAMKGKKFYLPVENLKII